MLTAFGILGTFIGIVIGLSQIGGQMGGDSDQLKGAMGNLIGSLGVSFRTSIWGLILSVVSTILYTNARSKLDAQIERWVIWLEKTMPQATIHKLTCGTVGASRATNTNFSSAITSHEQSRD